MDAQQFLAEFGHIVNAPGGISQLRQMIYQLAITGKLTVQLSSDGDASQLLADISTHRERLIAKRQYKRMPKLESKAIEIPSSIDLPPTWRWTRLLDLGEISPKNEAEDEKEASFIPMSGIPQLHNGKLTLEAANWVNIKKGFTHFANGDVVVAKITPCFENGKAAIIDGLANGIGSGTTELHVFRPIHSDISSAYIYLFLRSPYFAVEGEKNMTGTAGQKRLPTEYFATRALPLPPAKEQARIVAKVDELMALCDTLEQQQQQRRKLQNALRQSTLQAVATATSPHELQTTWNRLADNFGQLFSAPEDVNAVREVIYQLAVTGYLVHQDASEENAKNLLYEINNIRERLIQERRYKRIMKLESEPLAIPTIELPPSWQWSRLLNLGEVNPRNYAEDDAPSTFIPMVGVSERYNKPLNGTTTPWHKISKGYTHFANGDVILAKITPCFENGKSAIIKDLPYKIGAGSTEFHVFRPIHHDVLSSYIYIFLKSPLFRVDGEACMTGTAGQKRLPTDYFALRAVPLPPAKEQIRIVAKVEELMTLCNKFEFQLREARKLAEHLCIAAISTFTGITTEPNEEPMKAPSTELIAPIRLGQTPDIKAQAPLANLLTRHNGEMSAKDLWQRYGGEIDAFYAQLKTEVAHGWIQEPEVAQMRQVTAERAEA